MPKIMWIDDEINERQNYINKIIEMGHEVIKAYDDIQAVKTLEEGNIPDLIIQDLERDISTAQLSWLPSRPPAKISNMTGWCFYTDVLKNGFPEIPVIINTFDALIKENIELADEYNLKILMKDSLSEERFIEQVEIMLNAQRTVYSTTLNLPNVFRLDLENVNDALIKYIASHPHALHDVSWSAFEKLIARLLIEMGYDVQHTKLTRDGGVDIWAIKKTELCDVIYAIDTKKYSPNTIVTPAPVRAIYGVVEETRANVGMIITTAKFGKAAREFERQLRYRISLKEFKDVIAWINEVAKNEKL